MDQELAVYLDRRFSELAQELKRDLAQELKRGLGEELKRDLAQELGRELGEELGARIAASAAETRRHFDVVSERLLDKIQLVGEGVIGVDQKLDRFRAEVADEFRSVDRRLLRLEARVLG